MDGAYFKDGAVYTVENGRHERLMSRSDILLRGDHNVENYMAAALAVRGLCSADDIVYVARNFAACATG